MARKMKRRMERKALSMRLEDRQGKRPHLIYTKILTETSLCSDISQRMTHRR